MAHPDSGAIEEHANHVEPIGLVRPPVPVDPDHRRTLQLLAFTKVDGLYRTAELRTFSRLYLNERDRPISLYHQIDVAMTAPEPALDHAPASPSQPPFCDSFSKLTERLPSR